MKRFFIFSLLLLVLVGCRQDQEVILDGGKIKLHAERLSHGSYNSVPIVHLCLKISVGKKKVTCYQKDNVVLEFTHEEVADIIQ